MSCKKAVLFDLDGTLLDTAPDFLTAINQLLTLDDKPNIDMQLLREYVSFGSKRMVEVAFGNYGYTQEKLDKLKNTFLDLYHETGYIGTRLFTGMHELLMEIEDLGIDWGIVTNKPTRFTMPILDKLELASRSKCIVCGDTTNFSKPHPAPMLHALNEINRKPEECIFIGDSINDIDAGHAANIETVLVSFGYIPKNINTKDWNADYIVDNALDILQFLK